LQIEREAAGITEEVVAELKPSAREQVLEIEAEMLARYNEANEDEKKALAPLLSELDVRMLAATSIHLPLAKIARMHIKNFKQLDPRNRRKVLSALQARRAMMAKTVFLKELAAVGAQLKAQEAT
jgi:hypothetical protein